MTSAFLDMVDVASELIDEEGVNVTLYRFAEPADAAKPWRGARTVLDTNPGATTVVKAVFVSKSDGELARTLYAAIQDNVSGTPPRRGRDSFIVAGASLSGLDLAQLAAVVDADGKEWRITGVQAVKPADVLYLVTLEVRQ